MTCLLYNEQWMIRYKSHLKVHITKGLKLKLLNNHDLYCSGLQTVYDVSLCHGLRVFTLRLLKCIRN